MKTFSIYKKRDGQSFKEVGSINGCENFEEAKIEFAQRCYDDVLNGKHGDNFIELSAGEEDYATEDGIYDNQELFFAKSELKTGIVMFREDVYTWEIREVNEELED